MERPDLIPGCHRPCKAPGTAATNEHSNLRYSSCGLQVPARILIIMISQPASIVRSVVMIAIVASGAVGCASSQNVTAAAKAQPGTLVRSSDRNVVGRRAVSIALQQVGTPYRYGGSTPSGFDCSGLVYYSYANAGKNIPRTTAGQWAGLAPVEGRNLLAGDLLFFNISGKMSHVGMYVGNGQFVHAPSSGKSVSIENLRSDYYRNAFVRAGRPN